MSNWHFVLFSGLVGISIGMIDYLALPPKLRRHAYWTTLSPATIYLAVALWAIPLTVVVLVIGRINSVALRFVGFVPITVLGLTMLAACLLRRRRALEAEVLRQRWPHWRHHAPHVRQWPARCHASRL